MILRHNIKLKPKKCKHCKGEFLPERLLQMVCSPLCAFNYAYWIKKKKESNDWKEKRKIMLSKIMTLGQYEQIARAVFQKYIRKRDENLPCISCGKVDDKCWQGSHYFDANKYSGLIFNEMNVHKSCEQCNKFFGGNIHEYRKGLIARYGIKYVEELESIANSNRNYKYTKDQLSELTTTYRDKLKNKK